jgi:ribosomal protein S18 acetylase RimI-like enzyme
VDGIRIRPATVADAAAIAGIHRDARAATMPYLPPQRRTPAEVTRWVTEIVLRESRVWVAVRAAVDGAEEVIGYAALEGELLDKLYLRPDLRRLGVGTLLLDELRRQSPGGLTLHVFELNTEARAFYRRHGFTVVGRGDGSGNMEGLPELILRWSGDAVG